MTETVQSESMVAEPWLVAHQRAHCKGVSALTTFQGLISDEIASPQSAVEHNDPAQIVLAVAAFVDHLLNRAHFIPGEFAQDALTSYYAHDYVALAGASGHAHYYARRGRNPIALACCRAGLKSMLADPHLALFDLMLRLERSLQKEARRIAKEAGYRNVAAARRDLDKRLAALEMSEPLMPRHKMWLKSLRKLSVVPDSEMNAHINRIGALNRLLAQRREEAAHARAAYERTDPSFAAARDLCEMAGLSLHSLREAGFVQTRSVWPEGPNRRAFRLDVETDRGPRVGLFYLEGALLKRRLAVLLEEGGALPLGSLTLARPVFEAIVPQNV